MLHIRKFAIGNRKRPARRARHRRNRRGSILIFVVALLTLIALVGTALVATSRVDRSTTQIHVQNVSLNATRDQFQDLLKDKVLRSIARGYGRDVDSPRTDPWLADRLPVELSAAATPPYSAGSNINISPLTWPKWRFTSGIIDRYDPDLFNLQTWQPPHQYNPSFPESLLSLQPDPAVVPATNPPTYLKSAVKLDANNPGLAMVPHHLSITYPLDHPEENMRGKTRTFPAAYFVDRISDALPTYLPYSNHHLDGNNVPFGPHPFLVGDADGDGIADAPLFRLSPSAVDGVTYYGAIRVVDNLSAINVNTAYLRTAEVKGALGQPLEVAPAGLNPVALVSSDAAAPTFRGANNGFFASDIGLYELLDPAATYQKSDGATAEGGGRRARDNELVELDEFRLGYPTAAVDGTNDQGGWNDAFEDFLNPGSRTLPAIQPMFVSFNNNAVPTVNNNFLVAIEDRAQDPGDVQNAGNLWNPDPNNNNTSDVIGNYQNTSVPASPDSRFRPDFTFPTQNAALATMASNRWQSTRFGSDLRLSIKQNANAFNSTTARDSLFPLAMPENVDKTVGDYLFNHPNSKNANLTQADHALFPYRWLDEQEAASLAYHYMLVNPRGVKSTLDSILRHSSYRSAANWTPTISDALPTWSSFPSNEYQYWFQFLNFDGPTQNLTPPPQYSGVDPLTGVTFPNDISFVEGTANVRSFTEIQLQLAGNSLMPAHNNLPRFRSIRPLLTTHNPVNISTISPTNIHPNDFQFNHGTNNGAFRGIDWNRDGFPNVTPTDDRNNELSMLYPGMMLNDMVSGPTVPANLPLKYRRVPEPYVNGTQYSLNDMVYAPSIPTPSNRITWICIKDTVNSRNVAPWSAGPVLANTVPTVNLDTTTGEYQYWEPQQWVSGKNKTSVNTAGFPELWRAYFNVMSSGSVSDLAIDGSLKAEIDALATATGIVPPTKTNNSADDYAFFPSTASDPLVAGPPIPNAINQPEGFYFRFYDPYRGMRFHIFDNIGTTVDPTTGMPTGALNDPTFDPAIANAPEPNGIGTPNVVYETNKLGMFRSVIRDPRPVRPLVAGPADANNPDEYIQTADATKTFTNATAITDTIRGTGAGPVRSPQERLTPLQMATLRSAIAAFNTQDMLNVFGLRDNATDAGYNINDVPAKTIVLYDNTRELPNPGFNGATTARGGGGNEAANNYPGPESPRPQYEVTIYGNRPQLFISEVYANNDAFPYTFPDTNDLLSAPAGPAIKQYQNPNGYVAIELYNPYDVPVDTRGWVISSINRNADAATGDFGQATHQLGGTGGAFTPITFASLGITSVGPKQVVVIDSYNQVVDVALTPADPHSDPAATRQYRPPATGLFPLWETHADESFWKAVGGTYTDPGTDPHSALDPSNHATVPHPAITIASSAALEHFVMTGTADKELVILRPRKIASAPATPTAADLVNMVPVDQFDFTGMLATDPSGTNCQAIHYARNTNGWQVVYPGRYDGGRADPNPAKAQIGPRRFQGTWVTPPVAVGGTAVYTPDSGRIDPWISPKYNPSVGPGPFDTGPNQANQRYGRMSFGFANTRDTSGGLGTSFAPLTTINFTPAAVGVTPLTQDISIPLLGYPLAYNPMLIPGVLQDKIQHPVAQTVNQFPYGGFARNGDILQVPFIAAYRIRKFQSAPDATVAPHRVIGVAGIDNAPGVNPGQPDPAYGLAGIIEMNSISMDAAFAEDTDVTNDNNVPAALPGNPKSEYVGRFHYGASPAYAFAGNLFKYLDVHVPTSDYLPDANPAFYPAGSTITNPAADAHLLAKAVNNRPGPGNLSIAPGASPANELELMATTPTDEDSAAVQGLINLNTAPPKVLSMLPLVPTATGIIDVANTNAAAKDIYSYATGKDISSLLDLNLIKPAAATATTPQLFKDFQALVPFSTDQSKVGDVYPHYAYANTPPTPPPGTTVTTSPNGDIMQQNVMINRISNLVTTKSDTFTVYLLVQGWREAGTQFPVLDWEKRQAYIVDRSTGTLRITRVPSD